MRRIAVGSGQRSAFLSLTTVPSICGALAAAVARLTAVLSSETRAWALAIVFSGALTFLIRV